MKILIVGVGIAGSTLGYALRRAGLGAVVAEARSDLEDTGGAFLTLAPNGVNALRAIGLDDGRTVDADLVIGADGIWSTVRRLTWPEAPTPTYTGIVDCGGWAEVDLPDSDGQQMYFAHQTFFGYAVKNAMASCFTNVPRKDEPGRPELDNLSQDAWMAEIRQLHARHPEPVRAVPAAAEGSLGTWPIYDMPELDAWNTATVCPIGDAAHAVSPSSGQRASLAIKDAVTLAAHLRGEPSFKAASTGFVPERKERAEKIVHFGHQIGDRKISSTVGNIFRDLTPATFLRMGAKSTKEQYSYRIPAQPEPPTSMTPGAQSA